VSEWRLCSGCGACEYICPRKNVTLRNIIADGIRPTLKQDKCEECDICLKVCPGYETGHDSRGDSNKDYLPELRKGWGSILEVWEGYAADPDVRYHGSSGGLASALALYCLEKKGMHGVLHIGADENAPYLNKTVMSRTKGEILDRTGSRYAPASPCDGLESIETAPQPCVFIGKPCDVAGVRKAQRLKQKLADNIGLAIGIFCAGTPSTQGTLDLLKQLHIKADEVELLRYRGKGWPGKFSIKIKGEAQMREVMTYEDSWGFVQKYRPYRCHLCPDGTGEFSDIACGDPWYRAIKSEEKGYSLALVRTPRGREILHGAIADGYVILKQADPGILNKSQKNLLSKRGAVWGRLIALKALGIPTPQLNGFYLFNNWLDLSIKEKARSVLGTARRSVQRKYYKPIQ
jgi:coenzyme F420 hydrogenase subunit beta